MKKLLFIFILFFCISSAFSKDFIGFDCPVNYPLSKYIEEHLNNGWSIGTNKNILIFSKDNEQYLDIPIYKIYVAGNTYTDSIIIYTIVFDLEFNSYLDVMTMADCLLSDYGPIIFEVEDPNSEDIINRNFYTHSSNGYKIKVTSKGYDNKYGLLISWTLED